MGIYDRDYYRQERSAFSLSAPRSVIGIVILINAAVYVADFFYHQAHPQSFYGLAQFLGATPAALTQPWQWWRFVTYGFAHSPILSHVLFNMLTLFFLGQDVEVTYGRKEFWRLYVAMIIVGGVGWSIGARLTGQPLDVPLVGASAGVTGVVILFALLFPRRTILLFFVIPVPAWLLGFIVIGMDMMGTTGRVGDPHIAYTAHLAGAAFAILYFQQRWNLTRWTTLPSWPQFRSQPRLRVHEPEAEEEGDLNAQVDQILEKISRQGESSLSRKERRILEEASRKFQQRRRGDG